MIILLIIGFISIVVALGIAAESVGTEERFFIMGFGIAGIAAVLGTLISAGVLYEDVSIISEHTDHDKTRIVKENGETKELYITIDGKEYHFDFKEEK
jgi:hypothetical protein